MIAHAHRRSMKCPLSHDWLVDPVRNQPCDHLYSKAAIIELLHTQQRKIDRAAAGANVAAARRADSAPLRKDFAIVCPVGGCRASVCVATLEENAQAARDTEKEKREAARAEPAAAAAAASNKRRRVKQEDLTQQPDGDDEEQTPGRDEAASPPRRTPSKRAR